MTAAQALGAVPVPLYQDAVADEMAYVLDNADVKIALIENQEQVDKLLEIRERCRESIHPAPGNRLAPRPDNPEEGLKTKFRQGVTW